MHPTRSLILSLCLMGSPACGASDAAGEPQRPDGAGLPISELQRIAERIPDESGAPGAVLAVSRGEQFWSGASGVDDVASQLAMGAGRRFRAGSVTKMFTAAVLHQLIEEERLAPGAKLSEWFPLFPNADRITIEMLLSHTAGVTTHWLDDAEIQALVIRDLARRFTPVEAIELAALKPPAGLPGETGLAYANAGYVLLGEVAARITGTSIAELIEQRVVERLGLNETSYQYDDPPDLAHGYFEFAGSVIDVTALDQEAIVSFAGAAGAVHSSGVDLVRFLQGLFESEELVSEASRDLMMTEADPGAAHAGAGYGHGLMAFCPCADGPEGRKYAGWGHGGNLPGYWSIAVYYPEKQLAVTAMMNRTVVDGVAIDRSALDAAAAAVFEVLDGRGQGHL